MNTTSQIKIFYTPTVKEGHAFFEISKDFSRPAEIFREAIANALDAYARNIWLRVQVESRRGREVVIIDLCDDGIGMARENVESFLNLSDSEKPDVPPSGMSKRRMTGYKGHGTKVYYNSDELEILTLADRQIPIYCRVSDPMGNLADGCCPTAEIETITLEELQRRRGEWGFMDLALHSGTTVRVIGYHQNLKKGLEHSLLSDYIRWFTRWGSWEPKLRTLTTTASDEVNDFQQCSLYLRGLGKEVEPSLDEKIPFGHVFPLEDCTDIRKLRVKDNSDPLKHYVRTWAFSDVALFSNPEKRIDFIFALEGEGARREYNDMLRRQGKPRRAGDYLSEERYGLWLCRDYVPIQRFNNWVSERSEYTRIHAFVNCDSLNLTANRGSVENTPQELLEDIEETVRDLYEERVVKDDDFTKFLDEMLTEERYRHASKEAADYKRRVKRMESKQHFNINGIGFLSPHTETDLIALVSGVQALIPDILPFVVRDYDSHFGFDGLATRSKELAPIEAKHLFVEFKMELAEEFNHSFENLEAIICWNSRLKDGQEVVDLRGQKGRYTISVSAEDKKTRFVVIPNSSRNVEVIVMRDLLEVRGYKLQNIGE
jgi:hypothetical protein